MIQDMVDKKNKIIHLFLVEDSPLIREIVLENLDSLDDVEVVGYSDTETESLSKLEVLQPDLVIVDQELNEGNGLGVLERLNEDTEKFGNPKKVVFTNHTSPLLKRKCEALDIQGFYDKSYQLDELLDYIENITQH